MACVCILSRNSLLGRIPVPIFITTIMISLLQCFVSRPSSLSRIVQEWFLSVQDVLLKWQLQSIQQKSGPGKCLRWRVSMTMCVFCSRVMDRWSQHWVKRKRMWSWALWSDYSCMSPVMSQKDPSTPFCSNYSRECWAVWCIAKICFWERIPPACLDESV